MLAIFLSANLKERGHFGDIVALARIMLDIQ
jgi:hypothetical protein